MNSNIYIAVYSTSTKYGWGEVVDPIYDEKQIALCPKCKGYLSGMKWIGEKTLEIRGKKIYRIFYIPMGVLLLL